ncbi:MAG TPA: ABC transporter permease [Vicinamibacterales bacterium]|nr:ABC transporter permease [Vicinamibacterales bacterium]
MPKTPPARRPFWFLGRRPETVQSDVDEELNVHLEMRREELTARGLSADAARHEALRQFGDLEGTREYCRRQGHEKEKRMRRLLMLDDLTQDLRISFRGLRRAPLMTLTIIATVGLGIGATTTIFSGVNASLLRPLPYRDPGQLVRIYTDSPPNKWHFSVADYLALQAQQTHFERIGGYSDRSMAFSDAGGAERLQGRIISWTFLGVLGVVPVVGRDFTELDSQPGRMSSVIVSQGFWQQRLGGREDVIGSTIRLDAIDHQVVGVLPPRVGPFVQGQQFFVAAQWSTPRRRGPFFIRVVARLRPDVSRAAAAEELRAISHRIFPIWRVSYQDEKATFAMMDLKEFVVGDVHTIAGLALASVALVWLIACTNASNLLIARVTSRRRELAVRSALGASRARVVRYLLAESSLLAMGSAAIGIAIAWGGVNLLRELATGYFPRAYAIAFDGQSLAVLIGLTAASALLFGLIPSVHGAGGPVDESLRSLGRSSTGSRAVRRLRRVLVASQFTIATPLLVTAGLLAVSLNELGRVDLGFDSRNILSGGIQLPNATYGEPQRAAAFWDDLKRRAEALPGVAGIAYADGRPPNDVGNINNFDLEDFPAGEGQPQPVAPWVSVTPDYFRLLGLTLLQGQIFDEREGQREQLEAVVVDRAWATRFFPGQSAVGKRFKEGGCTQCPWTTVVGVVSDVKYAGLEKPDEGSVYWPMGNDSNFRYIVLRTRTDPAAVLPGLRQVVRELDAGLPFSNVATVDELVARSLQRPRSLSLLVGSLALVALILSTIGIYGVMAYYVQQHTKDIGIRVALGGSRGALFRLVVGQGMKVVAAGIVVGLAAAFGLTRLMSSLLFGVSTADTLTFVAVGLLLSLVALIACAVPAKRAVGVAPAIVLRND